MFEKGPGVGYMAAKDDALALDPTLRCRQHCAMGLRGYVVWRGEKPIASAAISRDAWSKAIDFIKMERPQ